MAGDFMPESEAPKAPEIHNFKCMQCGTTIEVHVPGQSLTFACGACGSIVQEDNTGQRILTQASQLNRYKPLFTLGSKVTFRGFKWQIIGFMVRSDAEESYFWREYLLFNPYEGYRFLMEADGHWNFMFVTKKQPSNASLNVKWGGRRYRRFYIGNARVRYVLGEFYWRVKVGDSAAVQDFIAPPDILSSEKDEGESEITWTAGIYIPADDIQKAFNLIGTMPQQTGVAPNQPSKFYAKRNSLLLHWLSFVILLIAFQLIRGAGATKKVYDQVLIRDSKLTTELLKTQSFQVEKDGRNMELKLRAPLTNTWLGLSGKIVPEDGQGQVISFQRELASYDVGDDDSPLRETSVELFFPKLPKGHYHFEFQLDRDPALLPNGGRWETGTNTLEVLATLDPPLQSNLIICLILISIYPLFYLLRDFGFENSRWSTSNQMSGG